jgi:GMP synthase (glutamine-hydrolysing)
MTVRKTVLALRHVHFEDLGSFAGVLEELGYDISYSDVGEPDFCTGDPCSADLLVVLGGPIGVYDDAYPFLDAERAFIGARLAAGLPTLGICLGAQLIAVALGAAVFPTGFKEIGFSKLALTAAGRRGPLRCLDGIAVLHWHGDTYSLPREAEHLASSTLVEQQAFSIGLNVLGLQFHPEVEADQRFERWLVGHAAELASAGIEVPALRAAARDDGPALRSAARLMLRDWLDNLDVKR